MFDIEITDNFEKQVEIGKYIFSNYPQEYSEARVKNIFEDIKRIRPNISEEETMSIFYHSIYDYWVYGVNTREEFFLDFLNKTHEQKKEYITFRNRFKIYSFLNNKEDEQIFKNKYETYVKYKNFFLRDIIEISGKEDYPKFVEFIKKHKVFFIKPTSLGLGIGVTKHKMEQWNGDIDKAFSFVLEKLDEYNKIAWGTKKSIVIEEEIVTVESFARFHPSSCNRLRITTIYDGKNVKFLDAWISFGMHGADIAAALIGEIFCGVDLETGVLETVGRDEFTNIYEKHPDSGIVFKGSQLEKWQEAKDLVVKLAKVIPSVKYVGWDLALTEKGWDIIEANENGEFIGQICYQKPYKQYVYQLAGMHDEQFDYWWKNK